MFQSNLLCLKLWGKSNVLPFLRKVKFGQLPVKSNHLNKFDKLYLINLLVIPPNKSSKDTSRDAFGWMLKEAACRKGGLPRVLETLFYDQKFYIRIVRMLANTEVH